MSGGMDGGGEVWMMGSSRVSWVSVLGRSKGRESGAAYGQEEEDDDDWRRRNRWSCQLVGLEFGMDVEVIWGSNESSVYLGTSGQGRLSGWSEYCQKRG